MHFPPFLESKERKALSAALLIVAVIWIWAIWPKTPVMTVSFISVGQGDSALIESPSGKTVLIDAGPCEGPHGGFDAGTKAVVPYLRHRGINSIDVFAISHPHEDHIGGAKAVMSSFPVQTVLDSGLAHPTGLYKQFLEQVSDRRIEYKRVRRGMMIDLHDGVTMEVICPPEESSSPNEDPSEVNNTSVVLRVNYGSVHMLFTGDAERGSEEEMLSSGCNLSADVLKVPHHGSAQATVQEWMSAIRPKIAVISVGWHNQFGHPSEATIARLKDSGADVYRTDQNGTVTLTTDGHRISVETAK